MLFFVVVRWCWFVVVGLSLLVCRCWLFVVGCVLIDAFGLLLLFCFVVGCRLAFCCLCLVGDGSLLCVGC